MSPAPGPCPPKTLHAIEPLRAYMAWWVVAGHALQLIGFGGGGLAQYQASLDPVPRQIIGLLLRGDTAVHVFIILSGFVIAHLLLSRREGYLLYLRRRALRLVPVYAVCLIAALLVLPLYTAAFIENPWTAARQMRLDRLASEAAFAPQHLLAHATLLHGVLPDQVLPFASSTFLAPGWSLSLEWQFYLLAPVLFGLLASRGIAVMLGTVAVLMLVETLLQAQTVLHWQYDSLFFLASGYFLAGMLCRLAMARLQRRQGAWLYLLLAGGVMVGLDRLAVLIWVVWFAIILWEAGIIRVRSRALQALIRLIAFHPALAHAGRWSYATYLAHVPVFAIIVGGYGLWVGPIGMEPANIALALLAALPVVLGVSAALHYGVERPVMRYATRRRPIAVTPQTQSLRGLARLRKISTTPR